jgi:hypothetical protein
MWWVEDLPRAAHESSTRWNILYSRWAIEWGLVRSHKNLLVVEQIWPGLIRGTRVDIRHYTGFQRVPSSRNTTRVESLGGLRGQDSEPQAARPPYRFFDTYVPYETMFGSNQTILRRVNEKNNTKLHRSIENNWTTYVLYLYRTLLTSVKKNIPLQLAWYGGEAWYDIYTCELYEHFTFLSYLALQNI